MDRRPNDRTAGELRDKGFEIDKIVPIVGTRCVHDVNDLRIVARGKVGVVVRCKSCQRSGIFLPVPERPLSSTETDLMVALAREAAWTDPRLT